MKTPARAVGLPWFEPETYQEVLALMEDRDTFFKTYSEWHAAAQRTEEVCSRDYGLVSRALIRPAEFEAWCASHGYRLDSKGRGAFARWVAAQEHGTTQ